MQLAIPHEDMLQCPCGLQLPLVVWRLDSTAQRGEETAVADRECTDEGQVPDYPESSHFRLPEQVVPLSWQKYPTRAWTLTPRLYHRTLPEDS